MDGKISIKYLQNYIRGNDYYPERKKDYFLKLAEEVGELSSAIRKDLTADKSDSVKETIDEEIWDVIYYALALANCYDIDMEQVIPKKEAINVVKYNSPVKFEENR